MNIFKMTFLRLGFERAAMSIGSDVVIKLSSGHVISLEASFFSVT